jgi:hypothetical protein
MTDSSDLFCPVCGRRLPLKLGFSEVTIRKIALALLIPALIYIAMSRILG